MWLLKSSELCMANIVLAHKTMKEKKLKKKQWLQNNYGASASRAVYQ